MVRKKFEQLISLLSGSNEKTKNSSIFDLNLKI